MQIRYTAIMVGYVGKLWFKNGFSGSQLGFFTPTKKGGEWENYRCLGFYWRPWFASDIPVPQLPSWYRKIMKFFSWSINMRKC